MKLLFVESLNPESINRDNNMKEDKKQCKHKWLPNGITTREIWHASQYMQYKCGETIFASAICEKCGEIKIKKED